MEAKVGQYYFGRHRSVWGIWQYDVVDNGFTSANHIKDVCSYEEAVKEVYRLNGWGTPKTIRRRFYGVNQSSLLCISDYVFKK